MRSQSIKLMISIVSRCYVIFSFRGNPLYPDLTLGKLIDCLDELITLSGHSTIEILHWNGWYYSFVFPDSISRTSCCRPFYLRPSSPSTLEPFAIDPCLSYCSPEMTADRPLMGQASDIFSLGLVIAQLAAIDYHPLISLMSNFDRIAHHRKVKIGRGMDSLLRPHHLNIITVVWY